MKKILIFIGGWKGSSFVGGLRVAMIDYFGERICFVAEIF